ncbi:MAG TPA: ATPase [Cytophagales bacterium]|nr:ATPase [Cytophagales bacterium]
MEIRKEELIQVLGQFNPWWQGTGVPDLPSWQRAAFGELIKWTYEPPAQKRAVFLSGARQVGKTTLVMQAIDALLKKGVPASNIVYTTFDHPIMKLAGVDSVLAAWREREPKSAGTEYVFLDEAQFIRDWGTWVKHQVDFNSSRRIIFTGSAMPIMSTDQESGVGRWHTIKLTTLSFYEYLQLKKVKLPQLPNINSLLDLYEFSPQQLLKISEAGLPYLGHFHNYLIHGGFPQTALVESITQAQKLLREDIIDKAIKRDMTALFGVRRVLDLEQIFLYICRHDGGILDMQALTSNLQIARPTAQNFIELLEATHLIYRLSPYGYGKEILRGRYKIYLADAAIAPAVMLRGRQVLDNPEELGIAAEAAVLKHLFARYYRQSVRFSYWHGKGDIEVDLVSEIGSSAIPFEVKYRSQPADIKKLKGIISFCKEKKADRGYVVTKSLDDIGRLNHDGSSTIFRIPAALLCYWMGEMELREQARSNNLD